MDTEDHNSINSYNNEVTGWSWEIYTPITFESESESLQFSDYESIDSEERINEVNEDATFSIVIEPAHVTSILNCYIMQEINVIAIRPGKGRKVFSKENNSKLFIFGARYEQ